MEEEVEKLVFNILGMVILFVIVIFALYRWLGTPECDSLANQTAIQLKAAIEDVSKDNFPVWTGSEPPSVENTGYFKTSPIRLCQHHGDYSWAMQFMGGFPEYEIYYEEFPSGALGWAFGDPYGSLMWTEEYPWGGQQSGFLMWGAMRLGSAAYGFYKFNKYTKFLTAGDTISLVAKIKGYYKQYDTLVAMEKLSKAIPYQTLMEKGRYVEEFQKFLKTRDINIIAGLSKEIDTEELLLSMEDAGILAKKGTDIALNIVDDPENPGKKIANLVISKTETQVQQRVEEVTVDASGKQIWRDVQKDVYILRQVPGDATSDIIDATIDETIANQIPGYELYKVKPTDAFKNYVREMESVDPDSADLFKKVYSFEDDITADWDNPQKVAAYYDFIDDPLGTYASIGASKMDRFRKISWYRHTDEGYLDRLKNYFKKLSGLGYDTSQHPMTPIESYGLLSGLAEVAESDPDVYDNLIKKYVESDEELLDTITKTLGIKPEEAIQAKNIAKYVQFVKENTAGTVLLPNKMDFRVTRAISDSVKLDTSLASIAPDGWLSMLRSNELVDLVDGEGNTFQVMGIGVKNYDYLVEKYGENHIKDLVQDVIDKVDTNDLASSAVMDGTKVLDFEKDVSVAYFSRLGDDFKSAATKQRAIDQMGLLTGLLTQNTEALPVNLPRNFLNNRVYQAIYTRGTKYMTPSNWLYKGIVAADMRGKEACGDNSICIFNKGKAEVPFYLNQSVQDYFVRVWRPVNPIYQIAGLQSAMMHVPSHPRFYVVSPCFAIAKIWKTPNKIIFVQPEKVDMEGKTSNYCYADEGLINQYHAIWISTEALNYVLDVLTAGTKTLVESIVKEADPSNVIQMVAEMAISWPGWPHSGLDYTDMQSQSGKAAYSELLEKLKGV